MIDMSPLAAVDPSVADLIRRDLVRQNTHIHLIASENFASPAVMAASGSIFTNKYAEGYPGKRYYEGCEIVDEIEQLAIDRAKDLFNAAHANVQPHSGAQANMGVYLSLLEPGDKIMGMRLDQGGHLTHGSPVNFSGRYYDFIAYGLDEETELIDMDEVRRLALEHRPKVLLAGYSAYSGTLDYAAFRSIADEIGAVFLVDAAHFIGLVAGGVMANPMEYADIVTATTHKALRGPRGGMILATEEYATLIDKAVFPGGQGGQIINQIAAKEVCFREAARVRRVLTSDSSQRFDDGGAHDGGRHPAGLRRHVEPPLLGGSALRRLRTHGSRRGTDAEFDRHHAQLQLDPE